MEFYVFFIALLISCSGNIPPDNGDNSNGGIENGGDIVDYNENKENVKKTEGNSIQIDPVVLYTLNISPEEVISDLKKSKDNVSPLCNRKEMGWE